MIEELKRHYGWQKVERVDESRLDTDQGLKRFHIWDDETLLNWHIKWRDHCSVTPYVLMNRMIRTKDEQAYVCVDDQYVTVHDDIQGVCEERGNEKAWGVLFSSMIINGLLQSEDRIAVKPRAMSCEDLKQVWPHIHPEHKDLAAGLLGEAEKRMKAADRLRDDDIPLPMIERIDSLDQATSIAGMLIWRGTNCAPEKGYRPIVEVLKSWHRKHGQQSLLALLEAIQSEVNLLEGTHKMLLAEALTVRELLPLIENQIDANESTRGQVMDQVVQSWDETRGFVQTLANWFDQKKVSI
ncbi:hypothetical protein [Shouchella lonarensis]|uniref:Uncharacterized protein n=1 Tax=Shouchella lonarensis TaxID=1464122 RepID=A0A1G6JZK3_9BACI|nr:hypothetical protein [Shouchella lonarensis]SDC24147.1 hypothetical protein SAMN05421737_106142 [Shouchella lonarensis]